MSNSSQEGYHIIWFGKETFLLIHTAYSVAWRCSHGHVIDKELWHAKEMWTQIFSWQLHEQFKLKKKLSFVTLKLYFVTNWLLPNSFWRKCLSCMSTLSRQIHIFWQTSSINSHVNHTFRSLTKIYCKKRCVRTMQWNITINVHSSATLIMYQQLIYKTDCMHVILKYHTHY